MTVNNKNLTKLIQTIDRTPSNNCIMMIYGDIHQCNTPHCVIGWVWTLMQLEGNKDRTHQGAANWLGISGDAAINIAGLMHEGRTVLSLGAFDSLPDNVRQFAMLCVLDQLRYDPQPNWPKALTTAMVNPKLFYTNKETITEDDLHD